jgi:hypothetical protein
LKSNQKLYIWQKCVDPNQNPITEEFPAIHITLKVHHTSLHIIFHTYHAIPRISTHNFLKAPACQCGVVHGVAVELGSRWAGPATVAKNKIREERNKQREWPTSNNNLIQLAN